MKSGLSFGLLLVAVWAATPQQWASRTIYQVVTDRFARNDGDTSICQNLSNYCGGGFIGLMNNLDYIANMGFDAIWISPVIANTPGGYHGYWAQNHYEVNTNFGSAQDLINLSNAMHAKGMYLMLDVVANHIGPVGTSLSNDLLVNNGIYPFNQTNYYHSYCDITNWNDQNNVEFCWLADLPDLAQEVPYVTQTFYSWVQFMIRTYGVDGLRIDTCPEVPVSFWQGFTQASGVYTVCEVFNGDFGYVMGYQNQGAASGTLNYPMFFSVRQSIFQGAQSMLNIRTYTSSMAGFSNQNLLVNFVDNQDNARFLSGTNNLNLFKAAIAFSMTWLGIPNLYYGDEQAYAGGNDPNNREILWTNLQNTNSVMYEFVTQVVNFRKSNQIWQYPIVERYALDNIYVFTRGNNVMMAFTNSGNDVTVYVTYHPFPQGATLCNIFYATDCVTVASNGINVTLLNGETKLYVLKSSVPETPTA